MGQIFQWFVMFQWFWIRCSFNEKLKCNINRELIALMLINHIFKVKCPLNLNFCSCMIIIQSNLKSVSDFEAKIVAFLIVEICSKLTIKILERSHWRRSGVLIINFEPISYCTALFSTVGGAFYQIFQKEGLDRISIFRGVLLGTLSKLMSEAFEEFSIE